MPAQQECLGIGPMAANLEGTEVFVPITFRHFRFGLDPKPKLVEVCDADRPITHPFDQMLAYRDGQIVPSLDFGHQPPNTMRPSSSPKRFASSGSVAPRKRSANSKNCCSFLFCASIPSSISSRSIRFALSRRVFASERTWAAIPAGRLMLWRTVLFAILITPLCTKKV